jgi:hypothetical protein
MILDASIFFMLSFLSPHFLKVYSLNISSPDRPRHVSYARMKFKEYLVNSLNSFINTVKSKQTFTVLVIHFIIYNPLVLQKTDLVIFKAQYPIVVLHVNAYWLGM